MNDYQKGYEESKRKAHYFESTNEIRKQYSNTSKDFIKGFICYYNEYWTEKLMGEY